MFFGWLVWSLLAAFFWGVGAVFTKKSLAQFSPLAYNLLSVPLSIILLLPFAVVFGLNLNRFSLADFLQLSFITASYTLYYYVISLNKVSLSGTVLSTYPLVTMFFAAVFLGETLTVIKLVWIFVLMTGVVLIGLPAPSNTTAGFHPSESESNKDRVKTFLEPWFLAAAGMAVFVGFADFLAKGLINRVGVGNYLFYYGWTFIPSNLVAFWLDKRGRTLPKLKISRWPISLMGAGFLVLGSGAFFAALANGPASLVAPVSSLYAAITAFLALVFLKEHLTRTQALGVALSVLGVILIGS